MPQLFVVVDVSVGCHRNNCGRGQISRGRPADPLSSTRRANWHTFTAIGRSAGHRPLARRARGRQTSSAGCTRDMPGCHWSCIAHQPEPPPQGHHTRDHPSAVPASCSRTLTWWLCSTWSITSPRMRAPRTGNPIPSGIAIISASPTAPGSPSIRMNTPKG